MLNPVALEVWVTTFSTGAALRFSPASNRSKWSIQRTHKMPEMLREHLALDHLGQKLGTGEAEVLQICAKSSSS